MNPLSAVENSTWCVSSPSETGVREHYRRTTNQSRNRNSRAINEVSPAEQSECSAPLPNGVGVRDRNC
jgi:hypothetical protein